MINYLAKDKFLENNKPLILQRADPYILKHDEIYYFTASVPQYDRIELRAAKTIKGLADAAPRIIWRKHESGIMSAHIWAPEIHQIDGKWYIYFAAGDRDSIWEIRPYVLECDGDPMTGDWKELGAMRASADDYESFTDFSLDATVFFHKGKHYMIWAEKVGKQFGISNLYIASMANPSQLSSKRVLITTPELDWEIIGFRVNEGASIIKSGGKIYCSFSASATGAMYCMGLLSIDDDADLLDAKNWHKEAAPVLQTDANQGFFGPGHNSFTLDEKNNSLCVFHARTYSETGCDPLYDPNRHTYLISVKFDKNGKPLFDFKNIVKI